MSAVAQARPEFRSFLATREYPDLARPGVVPRKGTITERPQKSLMIAAVETYNRPKHRL